jgi:hypothetical protein
MKRVKLVVGKMLEYQIHDLRLSTDLEFLQRRKERNAIETFSDCGRQVIKGQAVGMYIKVREEW